VAIYDPRAYNLTVHTNLVSKIHFTKTIEGRKERKRKAWPEKPKTSVCVCVCVCWGGGGGGGQGKNGSTKFGKGIYLNRFLNIKSQLARVSYASIKGTKLRIKKWVNNICIPPPSQLDGEHECIQKCNQTGYSTTRIIQILISCSLSLNRSRWNVGEICC